ncbi:MAG: phosphoglucomutase [Gammaproteobacteria bacterium RIFCSPHIGHO2_12_FULL_41_20]|nr:MAG: phosphoglucomutase [Gammaproteobacteria bacterium RIFCSPHIGHO2_12_FULL_41_20]
MILDRDVKVNEPSIDSSIFRAYDIRGIVGETLTENSMYDLGRALGSLAQEIGERRIVVGRDGRLSGPTLFAALSKGLVATDCDVIDLGVVPTPLLYYATYLLETTSGVMLTGSHNPPEYNGLKMVVGGETLSEEGIQSLYQRIIKQQFLQGAGRQREIDIVAHYIEQLMDDIELARPLKLVIDGGHGVAGAVAARLYRQLGCEVHELYCEVDGNFPHHHPDPSQLENLQDLIQYVREIQADVGLAFDGDGDRLGVVTSQGKVIWPDRLLMLFAKSVLADNPSAKIIYDVKCTNHLAHFIRHYGGQPIMWKTGHSFIKAKLTETQALLAGEMSGHLFFKDRWYGFDDAIYAGARLLEILANETTESDALFNLIPDSVNTPEMKIPVVEKEKFSLMQRLIDQANFTGAEEINTIDGIRVNFVDGWGLVRPSNTTPCLILRFEAEDETALLRIQELFRHWLLSVRGDLELPF